MRHQPEAIKALEQIMQAINTDVPAPIETDAGRIVVAKRQQPFNGATAVLARHFERNGLDARDGLVDDIRLPGPPRFAQCEHVRQPVVAGHFCQLNQARLGRIVLRAHWCNSEWFTERAGEQRGIGGCMRVARSAFGSYSGGKSVVSQ